MIGRAPMLPAAGFAAPLSRSPQGMPFVQPRPPAPQVAPPASWSPTLAQQQPQAPPRRIIRAQAPDEPTPPARAASAPLRIPSPEDLGVAGARPAESPAIDWTAVHNRLRQLGATCFHLERPLQGGCRITCLLPTRQSGRNHRIEARADSEAEAVRLALARAEAWAAGP